MRYFLLSLFLLAALTQTGEARHVSLECNKDRVGEKWHHLTCCLLPNSNQYKEIEVDSCPNIQGSCGQGEMECPGPGPGFRCVPQGQCNPMRSSIQSRILNWLMPRPEVTRRACSKDCNGVCVDGVCMMYARAPQAQPTTYAPSPIIMPCPTK